MKEVLFYQEVTVFDFAVKCVIAIGFIVIVIAEIIEHSKTSEMGEIRNDIYGKRVYDLLTSTCSTM